MAAFDSPATASLPRPSARVQRLRAVSVFLLLALIVLGTAGVAIPLLKRIGINNILGFMLVGVILGPNILGGLALYWPPLSSLALTDEASVAALGELGVVFLLFLIGLELSP